MIRKEYVLTSMLFPDNEEIILGKKAFNSDILTSWYHDSCITKWLKEANAGSQPKLLFRASINGWSVNDFHSHCDRKGPTLTIIKTSEGYIFGGYNDQSWYDPFYSRYQSSNKNDASLFSIESFNKKSSNKNDAFLFSIESFNKMLPQKMELKAGYSNKAAYNSYQNGPSFGQNDQSFVCGNGAGFDLSIGSRGLTLKRGYTILGNTYELPPGTSNTFLTGKIGTIDSNQFEVDEMEVFAV